jgi:hypothetical protein
MLKRSRKKILSASWMNVPKKKLGVLKMAVQTIKIRKKCDVNGCNKQVTNKSFCTTCMDVLASPNKLKPHMSKFTSRDERIIHSNMLVGVHWNAHQKVWSIVRMNSRHSTGLVLGYASQVTLRDVTTHIDNTKQKKVIETGTKDRHAFMVGYIENFNSEVLERFAYYNPKQVKDFVDFERFFNGEVEHIESAEYVSLDFNFEQNRPSVMYQ